MIKYYNIALILSLFAGTVLAEQISVTHLKEEKKVQVKIGDRVFNEYRYGNKTKPIIYPIIGPHEIPMTRNYPMQKGVPGEATDHPHHQSMHFNHPINGKDFWHGKKGERIRNDEIVKAEVENDESLIVSRNSCAHAAEEAHRLRLLLPLFFRQVPVLVPACSSRLGCTLFCLCLQLHGHLCQQPGLQRLL